VAWPACPEVVLALVALGVLGVVLGFVPGYVLVALVVLVALAARAAANPLVQSEACCSMGSRTSHGNIVFRFPKEMDHLGGAIILRQASSFHAPSWPLQGPPSILGVSLNA
jgi:hypothetical protein